MGKQKAPRRVSENEALAVGTQIRGSAQKLNLVAGLTRGCICPPDLPICVCGQTPEGQTIGRKASIAPSQEEQDANPRSRSARLRGVRRIGTRR